MTPDEHYLKAEEILEEVYHLRLNPEAVAQAHVHALLAQIDVTPKEYHDEKTMGTVHLAIVKCLAQQFTAITINEQANQIISAMQNAGILFRERN